MKNFKHYLFLCFITLVTEGYLLHEAFYAHRAREKDAFAIIIPAIFIVWIIFGYFSRKYFRIPWKIFIPLFAIGAGILIWIRLAFLQPGWII